MRSMVVAGLIALLAPIVAAQERVVRLPGVEIDRARRQVRVECEVLNVDMPLEFFCVRVGGPEHETILRTAAKPSDIHAGLLLLGLKPGEPIKYSEAAQKWIPPHGPPLHISVAWTKEGQTVTMPANRMMRHVKTGQEMPATTWIFAGSRVGDDGVYTADLTGYVVSIVNFDLTLIDIPQLASNRNETLEWQFNPATVPPAGTKATMIIEPAGAAPDGPGEAPPATNPAAIDLEALRQRWKAAVSPHANEMRQAAQTHYDVIQSLRREQQKLIDEADRIQRLIDELQREYQDMTTPRPSDLTGDPAK